MLLPNGRAGDGLRPGNIQIQRGRRRRRNDGLPQPVAAEQVRQPDHVRGRRGRLLGALLRGRNPLSSPLQEVVHEEEVLRPRPVLQAHLSNDTTGRTTPHTHLTPAVIVTWDTLAVILP